MEIRRPVLFHILLLAAVASGLYLGTFDVPFHFDDGLNITENPYIKDLSYFTLEEGTGSFSRDGAFWRRFIGLLSFALNYRIHGLEVAGYHAVNIAVHAASTVLLYMLVLSVFGPAIAGGGPDRESARRTAFFAALIFAVHPVQTQAVTYIVQRLASMAGMFSLAALALYAWGRASGRKRRRWLMLVISALMAACAMKTKENAFVVPLLAVAYEAVFFSGPLRRRSLYLLPILLTLAIVPASLLFPAGASLEGLDEATRVRPDVGRATYLMTQSRVILTYLRLFLFPVNQNIDYDYPAVTSPLEPGFIISVLLLGGLLWTGILACRKGRGPQARLFSFGVFWFFIALSVESGPVPLAFIFEHRMYLPVAGLCMAAASGFYQLQVREGRMVRGLKPAVAVLCIAAILSVLTYRRNMVWHSAASLWADAVSKAPGNPRAQSNLGVAYRKAGMLEKAERRFMSALAIDPALPDTLNNLGVIYDQEGRLEEAEAMFRRAVEVSTGDAKAYYNLGLIYQREGRVDEALNYYKLSLSHDPYFRRASQNLSALLIKRGRDQAMAGPYSGLILHPPGDVNAHINFGVAYYNLGEFDLSIDLLTEALDTDPDSAEAHYNLGIVYSETGRIDDAVRHYLEAVRCDPGMKSAHYNLASVLVMAGRPAEAVKHYIDVVKLDPGDVDAHVNLAVAYYMTGRAGMSIMHLKRAVDLAPWDGEAHYNLGLALRSEGLEDEALRHFAIAERIRKKGPGR